MSTPCQSISLHIPSPSPKRKFRKKRPGARNIHVQAACGAILILLPSLSTASQNPQCINKQSFTVGDEEQAPSSPHLFAFFRHSIPWKKNRAPSASAKCRWGREKNTRGIPSSSHVSSCKHSINRAPSISNLICSCRGADLIPTRLLLY